MGFEPLTYVPFDRAAIDISQMNQKEIARLNAYHREVYEKISPYLNEEEKEEVIENCQFVVRKLAHFSIYAILGINILGFVNTYKNFKFKSQIEITLFSGFLYAVSDEFHQMFSGGRTASPKDVCIDTLGVLFGIGIFLLIKKLIKMTYTKSCIQNK